MTGHHRADRTRAHHWARWHECLTHAQVPSPAADLTALIQEVVGKPLYLVESFTDAELQDLEAMVARRAGREPLQHVLGKQYFCGLELEALPGVFCTRPETELLVEAACDIITAATGDTHALPQPVRVLDLCSGSGAIALALRHRLGPEQLAQVEAVEISEVAVASARRNAARLQLAVNFTHGDATALPPSFEDGFSLVVSNPPYVPARQLDAEAGADPDLALWGGGADGTEIPLAIARAARRYLRPTGAFLMEHDETQGPALVAGLRQLGYEDVRVHLDLNQRPRFLSAWIPRA